MVIDISAAISALEDTGVAAAAVALAYLVVGTLVGLYRNIRSMF